MFVLKAQRRAHSKLCNRSCNAEDGQKDKQDGWVIYCELPYTALGYDAGTEQNDQNCAHIPGPRCDGEPDSPAADTDEGFVYVSNGFHDLGTVDADGNEILGPATYDWRNPVALIRITRIR